MDATLETNRTSHATRASWFPIGSKVARDWDAVHLSFGGYLTSEQIRVESEHGWTYHWAWDHEGTLWLRWMFNGYERLEDYRPERSGRHRFDYSLFFAVRDAGELSDAVSRGSLSPLTLYRRPD